jgi:ketosteroid isomerase-like protein
VTVEVARRYAEAVDEEDWDTARELLDPDIEVVRPSGRRVRGADEWLKRLARARGFRNLDSRCESRTWEQHDGHVREAMEIAHFWRHDGTLAYTSHEETVITFRDGRIAGLESSVEHREPA